MPEFDGIARMNERVWDEEVRSGGKYTQPHLDLDAEAFRAYGGGKGDAPPRPWHRQESCRLLMRGACGKDVLCLASGGGQQSTAFGLLGANVTVLDLCEGQLAGDRRAAEHYGYPLRAVKGDMRDLSMFGDASFDIVFQAVSITFVPDVRAVYREVARVLRPGGLYRVDHINPATYPVCFAGGGNGWDGVGYRIGEPYRGGAILVNRDGADNMSEGEPTGEHRHLLSDIFNGLIDAGLEIAGVWEDPRTFPEGEPAQPGSEAHELSIVQTYFTVLARRKHAASGTGPGARPV